MATRMLLGKDFRLVPDIMNDIFSKKIMSLKLEINLAFKEYQNFSLWVRKRCVFRSKDMESCSTEEI